MLSQFDQSKKRKKMELSSSTSSSPLHFFKIILNHTIENKRLEIPKEFLKKFGNELSDCATIKVPSGSMWDIRLAKRRGAISFEKGWKEFMEFYSISVGHFLVFRYEGKSKFHVLIFNTTATEIEYPIIHNFEDKDQVMNLDSCTSDSSNGTSNQTESLSSRGGHVSLKTEPADEHDIPKQRIFFANTITTRRSNSSPVTQSKALAAAKEFKSEKPFFIAIMPASCVKNGHVNVPAAFKHPCFHQKTTFVNLRVVGRKSWDVKLIFSKKHQRSILSKGWMKFFSDNQLKPGDVCAFGLVDEKKIVMNVHTFRASQEAYSGENLERDAPQAARSKETSLAAAKAFKSKKPFFKNVPAAFAVPYLKHEIKEIPKEFLKKFGHELSDIATIEVPSGSMWDVRLAKRRGAISFEKGWTEFMEFYSISVGHFLVFRYEGDSKFHVLIFNTTATEIEYPIIHNFRSNYSDKAQLIDIDSSSTHSDSQASTENESSSSRDVDEHDFPKQRKVFATTKRSRSDTSRITKSKERAQRAAEAFRSEEPFFKAIMHASCVKSGGNMHVPSDFAIPYLQHKTTRVTLRVSGGKSWDVGVVFTVKCKKTTLSKGWSMFASDNRLHMGDVCVFELVDRKFFEMNVYIFRVFKTNFKDKAQVVAIDSCSTESENESTSTQSESSSSRDGQSNLETEPNNQLKLGDVCVFEPVDGKNIVMNVHIFRASQEAYSGEKLETNAPRTARSKEKSLASAKSFKAKKPSFKATMCRSYLEHGFVHVPAAFATQYLKHAVMKVTIRVSDGRTWKIQCITNGDNGKRAKLSKGWAKFVSDNHLNKGDICVFKLVNEETFELKASIVRVSQNGE
ncbi:B3 domain-containing protein LOC_Os12g40080-like [Papaver somniferum]|uniref:B3 domain-containing protein LOC_Os12g40080-like n=1 Tax=Papaver somniferum TaxID=3469 RepID=UPI000E6F9254|nr:B3 domain-containing protein LOC_Os12g40080-like [Papaver somniferum]